MRSIGIDIGSSQIRVVELLTTSKGFQISAFESRTLSRATGTDLELEIIEFLREVSQKYDPKQTRFCVAIRQDRVAVRNKAFPFADRLRIQKTLPFELEEDLPFTTENAIYDGKIARIIGNSSEVLACAVPKTHIENILRLLKDSGIEPHILTAEGFAFANLFEEWHQPITTLPPQQISLSENADGSEPPPAPRNLRLVLNIGHTRTLLCAFDQKNLVDVRSILWGGKQIVDAIAKKYNLPPSESQKELENKGFILTTRQDVSSDAKHFSDLISSKVLDLIRDLQLSILELRSLFQGQILEIQITGGVSGIQGLSPFLTQHLEIPVNKINVLDFFPNVFFEKTPPLQLRLGTAVGIAIEGLRKPRNPAINFLKNEFAKQNSFFKDLWKEWGLVTQVALAIFAIACVWTLVRGVVVEELTNASSAALKNHAKNIAKLPAKQANEKNVKKYISDNRKKIKEIRTLESLAGMNSAMEILSKVSSSFPSKNTKVDILEFSVKDQRAQMAGFIQGGREAAVLLQRSLSNVAVGGNVSLDAVQPGVGKTGFRISFQVDRNIQRIRQ